VTAMTEDEVRVAGVCFYRVVHKAGIRIRKHPAEAPGPTAKVKLKVLLELYCSACVEQRSLITALLTLIGPPSWDCDPRSSHWRFRAAL
jgi:hypothetical protein